MSTSSDTDLLSVKSFFAGQSIFITGATGLVGKILVEKLLRSCPDLNTIYVLLRPKKGKSIEKRLEQFLADPIFLINNVKIEKIVAIPGDISLPQLGISKSDEEALIKNVSIVYHSAATIKFNEPLRTAVILNVLGTKHVIDLCKKMRKLKCFAHISTAYSNPHTQFNGEQIHRSHILASGDCHDLLRILNDKQIEKIQKSLLGPFPHTYAFTKNMAEGLVADLCEDMPTCILRPSIVTPPIKEPMPGYLDSVNGMAIGITLVATGLVRASNIPLDAVCDFIPADIFANYCIVAAYATAERNDGLQIYNVNTQNFGALTNIEWQRIGSRLLEKYPLSNAIRPPRKPQRLYEVYPIGYNFEKFCSELFFAYMYDAYFWLKGRKRCFVKAVRSTHQVMKSVSFFGSRKVQYVNDNTIRLQKLLKEEEKDAFDLDLNIDWNRYTSDIYWAARGGKPTAAVIARDRRRMLKLKLGYIIALPALLFVLFWMCAKFFNFVF